MLKKYQVYFEPYSITICNTNFPSEQSDRNLFANQSSNKNQVNILVTTWQHRALTM